MRAAWDEVRDSLERGMDYKQADMGSCSYRLVQL